MKALADIIYTLDKPDTKKYSEIPLAIKYGTEEQYQPLIDEVRNKLAKIYKATAETKDAFVICKNLAERSEKSLDSLNSIKTMSQSDAEVAIKEINSVLNSASMNLKENLVFKYGAEVNNSIRVLMPDLLHNAFELVVNSNSPKEIAELGQNPQARFIINDTVSMAMSSLGISDRVAKEGNILSDSMKADDIKYAIYVISSLGSKINGEIIPSDKKIWILSSVESELESILSEGDNLLSVDIDVDSLSENYELAASTMKDLSRNVKDLESTLSLAKLPHDMLYEGNAGLTAIYEATSMLKAISTYAAGVENKADFLSSIQSDIVDDFRGHGVYDLPSVFKVHDPQETDWLLRYADQGTELYDEVDRRIKAAECDQISLEEELNNISKYATEFLPNDLKTALEQVKKEKALHLDAKASNEYNM